MPDLTRMLRTSLGTVVVVLALTMAAEVRADALPGVISVTGSAERRVQPDMVRLEIGIESRDAQLETARREAGTKTIAVLRILEEIGVAKPDIDSGSLVVQPEFAWNAKTGERRLQGYLVARTVRVRLLAIDKLGAILERSVKVGANQISPPQFALQDETRVKRQLLTEATRDAKQNAIAVAEGLGVKLGAARKIEVADAEIPSFMAPMMLRTSAPDGEKATTDESYKPGDVNLRTRVNGTFDIAP